MPPCSCPSNTNFLFDFFFSGYIGYVQTVLPDGLVTPDCFLQTPLIEGYVEFLKVHVRITFKKSHTSSAEWRQLLYFKKLDTPAPHRTCLTRHFY